MSHRRAHAMGTRFLRKSYGETSSKEKTGTLRVRGAFLRCLPRAWSFLATTGAKTLSPQCSHTVAGTCSTTSSSSPTRRSTVIFFFTISEWQTRHFMQTTLNPSAPDVHQPRSFCLGLPTSFQFLFNLFVCVDFIHHQSVDELGIKVSRLLRHLLARARNREKLFRLRGV